MTHKKLNVLILIDDFSRNVIVDLVETCDACLVIGTSAIVYPAAMFAPQVAQRNISVAEFNIEETPATKQVQ